MCSANHIRSTRIFCFKVVAVIILVQGKTVLSLLKVVLNNIALVIHKCDDDDDD